MARASAMARAAVVDAVGARPRGQASVRMDTSRCTSAAAASAERGLPGEGHQGGAQAPDPGDEGQELRESRRC